MSQGYFRVQVGNEALPVAFHMVQGQRVDVKEQGNKDGTADIIDDAQAVGICRYELHAEIAGFHVAGDDLFPKQKVAKGDHAGDHRVAVDLRQRTEPVDMVLKGQTVVPVTIANAFKDVTDAAAGQGTGAVILCQERGREAALFSAPAVAQLFLPVFVLFSVVENLHAEGFAPRMDVDFFMTAGADEKIGGKRQRRAGDGFVEIRFPHQRISSYTSWCPFGRFLSVVFFYYTR